ncbi:unnamed protein product [Toxocara canis]|uniref:Uncharacterized protein n=1 Tax=Toxocara canis TaxID=6265 RepID=A0A183VBQ2_TOXCA|nr:unnamed protein product [Toxocara canis]
MYNDAFGGGLAFQRNSDDGRLQLASSSTSQMNHETTYGIPMESWRVHCRTQLPCNSPSLTSWVRLNSGYQYTSSTTSKNEQRREAVRQLLSAIPLANNSLLPKPSLSTSCVSIRSQPDSATNYVALDSQRSTSAHNIA